MPRLVRLALLLSAALLAAPQPRPVAATISITSNPAAPLAGPYPTPPRPNRDDDFGVFGDDDDSDDDDDDDASDVRRRQAWERLWTVGTHTSASTSARDEIDEVIVNLPGRVFLSTASSSSPSPNAPLASILFTGSSSSVLDTFEVVSTAPNTIEIRSRPGVVSTVVNGYMLVEVMLTHAHKLKRISAKQSADVVVEPNVLVADASSELVSVYVEGSGSVYIHDTPALNVQHVDLTVKGSGDIELSTTQIEAKQVTATIAGSGEIRLFANSVQTKDVVFAVGGSGDVYVNSYNLNANTVNVAIAGSGDVSVYPIGKCSDENVVIAGSGNAYLGSIACHAVDVKIGGSGDVIVQASQSIDGGVVGSGDVKYVGVAPVTIAPKKTFFQSKKDKEAKPMAKAASHNKYDEARMHNLPERVPARLSVQTLAFSDRSALVPLVVLAVLAAWFIRHEIKKQNAPSAQELQPLNAAQNQVFV